MKRFWTTRVIVALALMAGLCLTARVMNRALIIDRPQSSDLILVISGDFALRTQHAVALVERGYASQVLVDESAETRVFGRTLAERRFSQLAHVGVRTAVCPIHGDSTDQESLEAAKCLQAFHSHRVLIVTSDFHTRRVLAVFRSRLPEITVSVASAPTEFSQRPWWSPASLVTTTKEWGSLLIWKIGI